MTRTPTPWTKDSDFGTAIKSGNVTVASVLNPINATKRQLPVPTDLEEIKDNAASIVKAVNAHDKLVEAVKALIEDAGWEGMDMEALEYEREQGNQMVLSTIAARKLLAELGE
jgi:hypothetical protein